MSEVFGAILLVLAFAGGWVGFGVWLTRSRTDDEAAVGHFTDDGGPRLGDEAAVGHFTVAPGPSLYLSGLSVQVERGGQGEPTPLLTEQSTALLVGHRIWHLTRSFPEGYRLAAVNAQFGTVAPNQRQEAVCKGAIYAWVSAYGAPTGPAPKHEAPHRDCLCGVNAYKGAVPLEDREEPYVVGEVYLWGRVIVHEDGYRAQYAYPKRLYVVDGGDRAERIAGALAMAYGVPCEVWDV